MTTKILFPSAIDYIRTINHNLVDNALGGRTSFVLLPNLYERAYALTYETSELLLLEDYEAPDESITKSRQAGVNIITSTK
jgi:hypothetical protein